MSKTFLEILDLKKSYEHTNGSITLFEKFNIEIKEGDLVALVGPSGSGKSSLLHILALLDDPSRGKIILKNQDTKKLTNSQKDALRRKRISIIFQDNNLLTDFTHRKCNDAFNNKRRREKNYFIKSRKNFERCKNF